MQPEKLLLLALSFLLAVVSGCATRPAVEDGPGTVPASGGTATLPKDPLPRHEPRSRYGNGPVYEVFGQRYEVMSTGSGYQERGVASWYGKKFHGKPTSSQETYDMYAMTAAHKTLPLPSYVKVTNLRNNRSVVVRVNDRGPFVANRIIDLSYAAAERLDMIRDGTTLVEVSTIALDDPVFDNPAHYELRQTATTPAEMLGEDAGIYVQVGAFGDAENARRQFSLIRDGGVGPAFVHEDTGRTPLLYRVRVGPIADVSEYDSIVERLQRLGISETHLITE